MPHLDGTVLEETAAQTQLVMCFTANGHVCGLQQLGAGEIESARLVPLIKVRSVRSGLVSQVHFV